jgi:ribosomal protein S18 acetylase RimI-like enzyme
VPEIRIIEIVDVASFGRIPPCADPGFDHRSCDYWEDADRGSKAARLAWLQPGAADAARAPRPATLFGDDEEDPPLEAPIVNPFARPAAGSSRPFNRLLDEPKPVTDNPFAPPPRVRPLSGSDVPRKLGLLGRGLIAFGSYAKMLLIDDEPAVYAQFGPLSAYPRALRLRELYPQLPDAPLPAVITCIATTPAARGAGHAKELVAAICDDLGKRGFAAVEAYPQAGARPDATSAATPQFWVGCGFRIAVDDERFPVLRRDLE